MNILHITDFHYSSESSLQIKVVQAIINKIKEINTKIDLVLFTGDLVNTGNKIENFFNAEKNLFTKLTDGLDISKNCILFCAGNHDIDRNNVHTAALAFFESSINSNEELNVFYSKKSDSMYIDSIKPSLNFNSFLLNYHISGHDDVIEDLYSIHYRACEEKTYAVVCLNTAWLSSLDRIKPKDDKGKLLIPIALLDEIRRKIKKVDKKIILLHHPLYFLKEFNYYKVENLIHNEFDLLFSGHVHKISSITRFSGSNGIFEHIAKASLTYKDNLGCTLIRLDNVEENKICVNEITYLEESNSCYVGEEIIFYIPCGIEKEKTISFRKKLFLKIEIEKDAANKLLLINEEEKIKDFLSLYNPPLLKKEVENGLDTKKAPGIQLEDLILSSVNYLILGKDKCGKTSLLKKIQLDCLINYSRNCIIPYYFDSRDYESKLENSFKLEDLVKAYFDVNKEKTNELLNSANFLLLIDNYSPNSGIACYLNEFLQKFSKIRFIACTEYNISRTVDIIQFGNNSYEKLFFHDLKRKEIIAYSETRLTNNQKKEEIQERVIQLCKQLELPLNYWTISLLLLIHNKSTDNHYKNLFSVLDICVDEIFNKKRLTILKSRISFIQLKTLCAELAKYLFLEHQTNIYSTTSQNIISFLNNLISENERISTNGQFIFDYLLACGILKQKDQADLYVFRLNGFFEYFLALQMTRDPDFKENILIEESKYLAFKNQLEIYSGFKRDDLQFLIRIFDKTKGKLDPILSKYSSNKDDELLLKINEPQLIEDQCRTLSIQNTLSPDEKAVIEDAADELKINSEVHLIKEINPEIVNSELIERYLSILSRVFKNLDEILGSKTKINEIFNSIIDYYCDLSFFLVDEYSELTKKEIEIVENIDVENFPELNLLRYISNISPIFAQVSLSDGLGHFNLERLIKSEIIRIEPNAENNQFKLFILYFLLLDIDLVVNKEYIKTALDKIKIPVLKYLIYFKLNYYLAFKAGSNKTLQNELSKHIQKARLNIDSKADYGEIHKNIQEKKKMSIIISKQA